jgi:prepilin-type N-terminal cleavage/methylation domain-containing protein
MKIPSAGSPKGFTLIELLVVIVIIVVLASAGFAAGNAAIQRARKATCLATATAIEAAVNNFFTEYGSMPTNTATDDDADAPPLDTINDKDFLRVLLGIEKIQSPLNTRGIKFLSAKEGKGNKNGLIYAKSGDDIEGLFDPWGGAYHVMLDTGYDEKLKDLQPKAAKEPITLNGRRVAVWSDGADGVKSTGKTNVDVKTWGN